MPEQLTKEEVAHVAHLARLGVTAEELDLYTKQLSTILDYVNQLQSVSTTALKPVSSAMLVNELQEDLPPCDGIDKAAFLAMAPAAHMPYLKVKAVLE